MFDFFYEPTTKRYDKVEKCVKKLVPDIYSIFEYSQSLWPIPFKL